MFKNNKQNPIQFIPKSINEKSNNNNNIIKNNNTKLSYEEIRKIIENKNDKEISNNIQDNQVKNKFNIVYFFCYLIIYTIMESITNSAEDYLIDGLSFKLPSGASYVQDRKSSTFWSVGSNSYTPVGGVKLVKFVLNGSDSDWLDPSSVVFQFELVNTSTTAGCLLRPLGQPHFFSKD